MGNKPAKVGRLASCLLNQGSNLGNTRVYLKKARYPGYLAVLGCFRKKVFAPWADQSC